MMNVRRSHNIAMQLIYSALLLAILLSVPMPLAFGKQTNALRFPEAAHCIRTGNLPGAIELLKGDVAAAKKAGNDELLSRSLERLAHAYKIANDPASVEQTLRELVELRNHLYWPTHPYTVEAEVQLQDILEKSGGEREAIARCEKILSTNRDSSRGLSIEETLWFYDHLIRCYFKTKNENGVIRTKEQRMAALAETLPPESKQVTQGWSELGALLLKRDFAKAEACYAKIPASVEDSAQALSINYLTALEELGIQYIYKSRFKDGERIMTRCQEILLRKQSPFNKLEPGWYPLWKDCVLADVTEWKAVSVREQGRWEEAAALYEEELNQRRSIISRHIKGDPVNVSAQNQVIAVIADYLKQLNNRIKTKGKVVKIDKGLD